MSGSGTKNLSSKPNFGISNGKKPVGAFSKPGFSTMGGSKVTSNAPVISKASFNPMGGQPKMVLGRKRQAEDDFVENEFAQIQQNEQQLTGGGYGDQLEDSEDPA